MVVTGDVSGRDLTTAQENSTLVDIKELWIVLKNRKIIAECACEGGPDECPIGDCDCDGQLRVSHDCKTARLDQDC